MNAPVRAPRLGHDRFAALLAPRLPADPTDERLPLR